MAVATGGYYTAGGSSTTSYDVVTLLGKVAFGGFIHNYGSGTITYRLASSGTDYGATITLPPNTIHNFENYHEGSDTATNVRISAIEIVANASSSTYMIFVR